MSGMLFDAGLLARLFAAVAAGGVLGLVFFGGLWLTVDRLGRSRRPLALAALSFGLRLAVAGVGFWVVLRWGPQHLVAALVGFLAMRAVLVRRVAAGLPGAGRVREVEPWS
jgi:F1F0 ATPase subunit 2